jgi:hypothetical protein
VRMVKKVYLEQMCLNGIKETKSSESENSKIVGENNVDCIFDAKYISNYGYLPEKQTVNAKFYKEVIKSLITQVHCIRPEFQESGLWYLLHDNAPAHSLGVVSKFCWKQGIPMLSNPPCSSDLWLADFFYFLN